MLATIDVATAEFSGSDYGIIANDHTMRGFEARLHPTQHASGNFCRRLVELDQLKATGECRIFLNIFFVFRPRGGGNSTQFAARQRGLQQISSVASTSLTTSTDQGMRLIDEKNNWRR